MSVSLCCPQCAPETALSALSLGVQRLLMSCMWFLNVSPVSYVTPSILVAGVCGTCILFSVMFGVYLCSWLLLVMSVVVDLAGAIVSLFSLTQVCRKLRYSC